MRAFAVVVFLVACTEGSKPDATSPGGGGGKADDPATSGAAHHMHGHHHDGDRHGLHGMVLFGRTHHYLEHIPMFQRPHNEQLVMRVTLKSADGEVLTDDFSDQAYSIRPTTQFSLDDVTLKKRATFSADVHRGNFEAGGVVIHRDVRISVEDVLVARNLPGTDAIAADEQEYFLFGEPDDAYLTNYIRGTRGFQQILRVDAAEGVTPSLSRVHRITTKSPRRLAASPTDALALIPKAGTTDGTRITLSIGAELWCLQAPEFFSPCE